MPAPIDYSGQKFSRLTALSVAGATRTGGRLWLFKCDCGNEVTLRVAQVKSGKTSSCGCLRRETTAQARAVDLTGQRFGRLLVTEQREARSNHGSVVWMCVCDCGRTTTGTTNRLRRGEKQSCGCIRRELMSQLGASSKKENPVSRTPEYRKEQRRKRRAQPHTAMAERVSRMIAWALASVGAVKRGATFDLLGYTPAQLKAHIERQFLPGMSWGNREKWQIDHITPISTATCEQEVIELNQLYNLRPLWSEANNQKRATRTHLL